MEWKESSYLISLFFFSGAFVLIGLLAWQRRKAPGSLPLVFFMLAVAEWTFVSAIEYSVGLLPLKIILAKIEYFGAVSSPIFFVMVHPGIFQPEKIDFSPLVFVLLGYPADYPVLGMDERVAPFDLDRYRRSCRFGYGTACL